MSRIRTIATSAYTGMAEVVQPGQFSLFTGTTRLPSALSSYAYATTTGGFYGILAVASLTSQNPPSLGGVRPRAGQQVYAVNTMRYDAGVPAPHVNVDRALLFEDERGHAHRVTFKGHPAHFRTLSADTGLEAVLSVHGIPHRPSGMLSELSASAGWQNFSTSFP